MKVCQAKLAKKYIYIMTSYGKKNFKEYHKL
jgi:hypothetical protein